MSLSFFPEENAQARELAVRDGQKLVWEVIAPSKNAAMRAMHDHMGWGEYTPSLQADGTPYPEDEDDDLLPPATPT